MEGNIGGTISKYFQIIKTIYKRNRVTIPYIPPLNIKSIKRNPYISFNDILTKEEIKNAISIANPQVQIRMMAMATGIMLPNSDSLPITIIMPIAMP